jgi:transcriptional/translational regulatory protein YebC/TACO1
MDLIEMGAEDIEFEDGVCIVTTSRNDYFLISNTLHDMGYKITSSDIECICENMVSLSESDHSQLDTLLEHLEDDDDVEKVWTNVE